MLRNILISIILSFSSVIMISCSDVKLQKYSADSDLIIYAGRVDQLVPNEKILIGSASSATIQFTGDTCVVFLKNNTPGGLYNYFSVELDGEDMGRTRIDGDSLLAIPIEIAFKRDQHLLTIYKSTEASNGNIIFGGVLCEQLIEITDMPHKSIEFIGNSITCGMGNDTTNIPCHSGQWYDQHNAFWAYGPIVARAINVNYMLSSVSGIGIYRNWDVEDGLTMPMVYENSYLNAGNSKKWDFSKFTPDLVSICLGTNDFSDGDGIHPRHPFNADLFTSSYIKFVQTIYNHYPSVKITLLSSPMLSGEKSLLLLQCLNNVKKHFENSDYLPIAIFEFEGITPHGCDYHPDIDDHLQMADQLIPFYQQFLDEED